MSLIDKINNNELNDVGRLCVFIDASNIWAAQKSKGKLLDFKKIKNFLNDKFNPDSIVIYYYSAYPSKGTRDYDLNGKHRFFTYLKKGLGFKVRKKELKRIIIHGENGKTVMEKGDMDVEISVDASDCINSYDTMVLFSGDSDFLYLISYLRKRGKKVYIFSSKNNISNELRTAGDGYCDILEIENIWRKEIGKK